MMTPLQWSVLLRNVAARLNRSFGYLSVEDRMDALSTALSKYLHSTSRSQKYLNESDLIRWLHRVAANSLTDRRRTQQRVQNFSNLVKVNTFESLDKFDIEDYSFANSAELQMDIKYGLSVLSPQLRVCFELHCEGFNADGMSSQLEISREAAYKRTQRARAQLQRYLYDYSV